MRTGRLFAGLLALACCWLDSGVAQTAPQIRVMALFPGKAMVSVDGVNRLLTLDEPSPEGLRLISADSTEAVIELHGQRERYRLGNHISGTFAQPELREVRILGNSQGAFVTQGSINGQPVRFMVDTGATVVAMSSVQADRLGIAYYEDGKPQQVRTASDLVWGYAVVLDRVRVGPIEQRRVKGVVIEGDAPAMVLLGMAFLSQVSMENKGSLLILQDKY
jgi:aspartyl protease family protein